MKELLNAQLDALQIEFEGAKNAKLEAEKELSSLGKFLQGVMSK